MSSPTGAVPFSRTPSGAGPAAKEFGFAAGLSMRDRIRARGTPQRGAWLPLVLLLLLLSVRLALLIPAAAYPERRMISDSWGFLDLAVSLRTRGTFEADEYTEEIRTPGYPIFVAALLGLEGPDLTLVIVGQVLLSAGVAGMLYLAGIRTAGASVGWAAAFLWAVNPNSIFWPFMVMSETLFAIVLAGSLLCVVLAMRRGSLWLYAVSGLALGMAVLVRPIGIYLIPVWFVILLVRGVRMQGRLTGWRSAAILAALAYGLVFAWQARNALVHGEFFLSKTTGVTLRSYVLARALADARGISRSDAAQMIPETADLGEVARQIFAESPWSFPKVIVGGIIRTALGTEAETWLSLIGLRGPSQGLLTSVLSGDFAKARIALSGLFASRENASYTVVFLWGGLYAAVAWGSALLGWLRNHRRLDSVGATTHWLAALSALYLLAVPLANGDARFRMPLDPLLAFLAGMAWLGWRGFGRRKAAADAQPSPRDTAGGRRVS